MAAFHDDKPLVAQVDEDWDEITTGTQIMRPDWDFSPIRMRTMHHLPHVFFDTLRPERPDCPVLVPAAFPDRAIDSYIWTYIAMNRVGCQLEISCQQRNHRYA